MTEDGARIELFAALEVPDRAYLWERQTNMVFECAVKWRKPGVIGVGFESTCGRVMRQAIVEACSLGMLATRPPALPPRRSRTGRRQRADAR